MSNADHTEIPTEPSWFDAAVSDDPSPFDQVAQRQRELLVHALLEELPRTQAEVLRRCFGIGCPEESLTAIGRDLGFSRFKARDLLASALRKFRHPSRASLFSDFDEGGDSNHGDYFGLLQQRDREHAEFRAYGLRGRRWPGAPPDSFYESYVSKIPPESPPPGPAPSSAR